MNVYATVDTCTYLNYMIDGSSNISYKRIVNLFVHIQMGVFQHKTKEISAIKYSASKLVQ